MIGPVTGSRPCSAWTGTALCGAAARLYPAGWRCAAHTPARELGVPEPLCNPRVGAE